MFEDIYMENEKNSQNYIYLAINSHIKRIYRKHRKVTIAQMSCRVLHWRCLYYLLPLLRSILSLTRVK